MWWERTKKVAQVKSSKNSLLNIYCLQRLNERAQHSDRIMNQNEKKHETNSN